MGRLFLLAFVATILTGCGTLQSKMGMSLDEPHQNGHFYSGVAENLGSWCLITHEDVNPAIKTLSAAFLVIDLPLSAIADTLFIPVDLVVDPEYPRSSVEHLCAVHVARVN